MRKALIVGIDHYSRLSCLHGCVNGIAPASLRSGKNRATAAVGLFLMGGSET
jgi:hypothetical protein